jgi:adenylate cyclase
MEHFMKLFKKRTFKVDIVLVFTFMIVLTVVTITSFVYFKNKASTLKLVQLNFRKEADAVLTKTENYMQSAQVTAEIATRVFDKPELKLTINSRESAYLLNAVKNQQPIELFYYGDEAGNFLQAGILGKNIYTKQIRRINGKAVTDLNYFDSNFNLKNSKSEADSKYDPRVRPWYKGAKTTGKTFWTEPYIFAENGKPGITVACPVYNKDKSLKGVVAADITLDGLSEFLKEIDISNTSIAFIIDETGKLLAYADPAKMTVDLNGKITRLAPYELKIPELTAGIRHYQDKTEKSFSYGVQGVNYLACFASFPEAFGKKWLFAVIATEDDFLGPIKNTLRITMLLSISGLIVAVLAAFLLARQVSRPIEKLAAEILKVKNFNLDETADINSHIHEIQAMDSAINGMKNSLRAFRLYVPATLVKQLIASGEKVTIGGKSRELTVFFSDIEDFTSITENISPKDLMLQLSDYFDVMTKIIEQESGTVDKFIGDAVMAFWGAPISNEEHAIMACRAALKCQQIIGEFNKNWEAEGKYPFRTRMGINTGYMIVGNMGSRQRMNYSVMGDGVNLASRLEMLNKIYSTSIIISKGTHRYVQNQFVTRTIDQITVKGKSQSVVIYELMAEKGTPDATRLAPLAERFEQAYKLYLKRDWQQAKSMCETLLEEFPDDQVSAIYIERCTNFIEHEPDPSWSGISKLFEK